MNLPLLEQPGACRLTKLNEKTVTVLAATSHFVAQRASLGALSSFPDKWSTSRHVILMSSFTSVAADWTVRPAHYACSSCTLSKLPSAGASALFHPTSKLLGRSCESNELEKSRYVRAVMRARYS